MAINADVTHSKRSPGIDKAKKIDLPIEQEDVGGEKKKKKSVRLHLVIMNLEPIPVGCIAGVMIALYFLYMPSSICLQGCCVAFDKMRAGWGARPEVMTIAWFW